MDEGERTTRYFNVSEEPEPERIVLIHVQHTRNADRTAHCFILGKWLIGKEQFVFEFKQVRHVVFVAFFANAALAAVAADKLASAGRSG